MTNAPTPERVAMASEPDYRSATDMNLLGQAVLDLPPEDAPYLCAFVVDFGLMLPSQWWMRLGLWWVRKRHGHSLFLWQRLAKTNPEVLDEMLHQTAQHIRHGKDRTTHDAAGGFNQREVDHVHGLLDELAVARTLRNNAHLRSPA